MLKLNLIFLDDFLKQIFKIIYGSNNNLDFKIIKKEINKKKIIKFAINFIKLQLQKYKLICNPEKNKKAMIYLKFINEIGK